MPFQLESIYHFSCILNHYVEEEKKVTGAIKSNPKAFYVYANKSRKVKTKIGPLKTVSNGVPEYVAGPLKMAEILSNQFEGVFTTPRPKPPPRPHQLHKRCSLT